MKTKLKIILLLVPAFLATFDLAAQSSGKCKFAIDKIDPITKVHVRAQGILLSPVASIGLGTNNDTLDLAIVLTLGGQLTPEIDSGTLIIFKFEQEETLKYYSRSKSVPVVQLHGGGGYVGANTGGTVTAARYITRYAISYEITKELFQNLATKKLTLLRIYALNGGFTDVTVKDKDAEKISKYASCLLNP